MPALGVVMVERRFEARKENAEEHEVILLIGAPFRDPRPGGDWCCPYQITGLSNDGVSLAFGVDSLQSFLLALQKARAELTLGQHSGSLRLTWLDQDDWGLPEPLTQV